jgi:enamine deaminase RidA (YjgF/YER057c/UK114 family)
MSPLERLRARGLALPPGVRAAAGYVPAVLHGGVLHLSGQTPRVDGVVAVRGAVGAEVSLEQACEAARICALRLIAAAHATLDDLGRVRQVIELAVFVRSAPGFTQQSTVADAASEVFVLAFGEAGRHARTAVGVLQLPGGAAVEIAAKLGAA